MTKRNQCSPDDVLFFDKSIHVEVYIAKSVMETSFEFYISRCDAQMILTANEPKTKANRILLNSIQWNYLQITIALC